MHTRMLLLLSLAATLLIRWLSASCCCHLRLFARAAQLDSARADAGAACAARDKAREELDAIAMARATQVRACAHDARSHARIGSTGRQCCAGPGRACCRLATRASACGPCRAPCACRMWIHAPHAYLMHLTLTLLAPHVLSMCAQDVDLMRMRHEYETDEILVVRRGRARVHAHMRGGLCWSAHACTTVHVHARSGLRRPAYACTTVHMHVHGGVR